MFDIGWSELLLIAIIAIIVVGPKDLPAMLRSIGKVMGSVQRMARDFRREFDQALKETELEDVSKGIGKIASASTNPVGAAVSSVKDSIEGAAKPLAAAGTAASASKADKADASAASKPRTKPGNGAAQPASDAKPNGTASAKPAKPKTAPRPKAKAKPAAAKGAAKPAAKTTRRASAAKAKPAAPATKTAKAEKAQKPA